MKIVTIVGARPQFIKLAPFSKRIRKKYQEIIVHTGQHYSSYMSEKFFDELDIPSPDYNLEVGPGDHGVQTGKMLMKIEGVLLKEKPDLVVVFGDTNSTLAGSLVASKLHIPVAHVESGLRSFNKEMPEEINRVLTDHCSDLLFAPTVSAMQNLENEGLSPKSFLTGDIMLDTLEMHLPKINDNHSILSNLNVKSKEYCLVTLHRPYNVDHNEKLSIILSTLSRINNNFIFPVHPRTRKMLSKFDIKVGENIFLVEPLGYIDFLALEYHAAKIITDSGGIQKEAYILKIPCITVRTETEWSETVSAGWNIVVKNIENDLYDAFDTFKPPPNHPEIFGKYSCADKMVDIITDYL